VLRQIRRSLALKLILASAIPSAAVLVLGLSVLVSHTETIAHGNPRLAFEQLRFGSVLGSLLTLTFAGIAVAITTHRFLVRPAQELMKAMRRAELGEFLVRAKVDTEDELGRLARSFNTMLARVTDMAAHDIEQERSLEQMQRELSLQGELRAANERLAGHVREMELLLGVAASLSGTLELPQQLADLGRKVCEGFDIDDFGVMLVDDATQQLVVEAVAGEAPAGARGMRFQMGEGIAGQAAAMGETIYVPDVSRDSRYLHYKGQRQNAGSFVAVPLRVKGRVVGILTLNRPRTGAFTPQEIRLAEAIASQAALAITNARLYAQTVEMSYTDPLTGVPNRRQLFARLEQEWTRSLRFGDELSLLMIDLDLFKNVNDAYGHTVGDAVLRGIALILKRNVRKVDTVARFGGEEFSVVLPRVAKAEAVEVAEKLRRAIAATPLPGPMGQPPLRVTVSIGVASHGADATDVAGLIEKADQALYDAKRSGRNAVFAAPPFRAHAG
jgi:diguanylate cyclase (GGDEF)-like protein